MKGKNVEQKSVELENQTVDTATVEQESLAPGLEEVDVQKYEDFAPIPEGTELSAEAIIKAQRVTITELRKQVSELRQQLDSTKNE